MAQRKKERREPGTKGNAGKREMEFISVRSPRSSQLDRPLQQPNRLMVFGLFALICFVFFYGHLTGSSFLWEDFTEQFLPFQTYAARSFADGMIPFWNPYTFGGMPFLADLQNGFFYPGHILMYLLSGGTITVWLAQFFVIVHYYISMVAMWRLTGELGLTGWGRLYSGIGYGLCGIMVAQMIHPNVIYHLAFFPLIIAFFWNGLKTHRPLSFLLSALTLGLVLLSGHPQSALYIVFFLFCLTLFWLIRGRRQEPKPETKELIVPAVSAFATVVLAAGIFCIQYLPSQELADLSQRSEMTYDASVDGSIALSQLVTLISPKFFGVTSADAPKDLPFWLRGGGDSYYFWETMIFIGVVTLLLALVGLSSGRLGGTGWFLFGLGLFGLLYGMGDNFLIHPMFGRLPLFSSFRIPARMSMFFALGMTVLAGVGIDALTRPERDERRMMLTIKIAGGVVILIAILIAANVLGPMLDVPDQLAEAVASTGVAPLLISACAVGIIWAGIRGKLPRLGVTIALLLLSLIDLFTFGVEQNSSPTDPAQLYTVNEGAFEPLKPKLPSDPFRVQMRGIGNYGGSMLMKRNQGPYSGIMLVEGYNPLLLQRSVPVAPTFAKSMELMDVHYAIVVDSATGAPQGYDSTDARYPHARLVYGVKSVPPEQVEATMKSGEVDFGTTAVVESIKPTIQFSESGTGSGEAQITDYEPNHIVVKTKSATPAFLVLSEVYYPAWKATVDGQEKEIYRVNWSQRGLELPAGEHTVEMEFKSSAFTTGLWITIISLLITIGGIIFFAVVRRPGSNETETRIEEN